MTVQIQDRMPIAWEVLQELSIQARHRLPTLLLQEGAGTCETTLDVK